jgi:hypothetical protein
MDLVTFRNTQGPIRERYANDAKAALLTLRAQGRGLGPGAQLR